MCTKVLLDLIRSTFVHFSIATTCFPFTDKDTINKLKNTITRLKSKISDLSIDQKLCQLYGKPRSNLDRKVGLDQPANELDLHAETAVRAF